MVIIYNPSTGAIISDKFKGNGFSLAKPLEPNTMCYCEPLLAEALVTTYPFLQIVTPAQAQQIKETAEKPIGEFKCDQCDFSSDTKIALIGHQRSHKPEEIIPDIPVAEVVKAEEVKEEPKSAEIPDDLKGLDWYGSGVKEDHG